MKKFLKDFFGTLSISIFLFFFVISCGNNEENFSSLETETTKSLGNALENYNTITASRLSSAALRSEGYSSSGRCYQWVANHLERAFVLKQSDWARLGIGNQSAYMFAHWANANPVALGTQLKFQRVDHLGVKTEEAPVGSILVYDRGRCGYSAYHGHIEVVAKRAYACSDFCQGVITEKLCGGYRPYIYIPIK